MQGGVDLIYYNYFGYSLENDIQDKIINEKHGELVVGDSLLVAIPNFKNSYLIASPTMRVPMNITETVNIYLAFRAALILISRTNILHVIVPGLGTVIGKVTGEICAKQMYAAYNTLLNPNRYLDLVQMSKEHIDLVR